VPKLGTNPLADEGYLKKRCGKGRKRKPYYVRVPVPKDLQELFRKRTIERPLKTTDESEAHRRKHSVLAEIFADFERARLSKITSADIEQEAQRYLRERLQEILNRPGDAYAPGQDELGNEYSCAAERELFELHQLQEDGEWPAAIEREADATARRYGAALAAEQREELCAALLRAEIQAVQRALAAHNGASQEPVPVLNGRAIDPLTAEVARPSRLPHRKGEGLRVSEAVKLYVAERNREKKRAWTAQTLRQVQGTFRLFVDFTRDAPLASIIRKDIAAFLSALAELDPSYGRKLRDPLSLNQLRKQYRSHGEGLSNKTLNRHSGALASLFEWAIRAGKIEGVNPAKGHHRTNDDNGDDPDARRPFTTDELNKLLAGPVFQIPWQERVQPKVHTPESTLAWLIPIALFSGMRLDEICGLRTQDLEEDSGILFFNVISHEGRRLKTAASRRRIPVHSELLRIGFGEYLEHVRRQGHEYLFPALKPGGPDNKRNWYIGKRFTTYRRSVGVNSPTTVFHCFRKNAATALERARVPENEAVQILGHKKMTMSYGLYSEGLDLPALAQVVEAIQHKSINLKGLSIFTD
jgi:integrase